MIKRAYPFPMIFAVAFAFLFIFSPQMGKSESPRTITLPSGEMVCDLSGEWNVLFEFYGQCVGPASVKNIVKIKQEGNRFVAIKLSGPGKLKKGDEVIRGELDQKGFKTGERLTPAWRTWSSCKGEITDDCKKIIMDEVGCSKITLERK
jgi:hypothetical protein